MKPQYFVALCVALSLYACSEDKLSVQKEAQSFTFQSYIVDYDDAHVEQFTLESNSEIIDLSNQTALALDQYYESGQVLDIETADIHQFLGDAHFDLNKIRLSQDLNVQHRSGTRRILGVIVNGIEQATVADVADVENMLFSNDISSQSLQSFYDLQSLGEIQFEGDVVEIDIPETITGMNFMRVKCEVPLQDLGYRYDDYDHICFFTDNTSAYLGLASVNGKFSHVDNSLSSFALSHEIGHNFGMRHASHVVDADTYKEYGDKCDVMGGHYRELNGAHRLSMGWLAEEHVKEMHGSSSSFELAPLVYSNIEANKLKVLTLPGEEYDIVLSLRTAFNEFDKDLDNGYRDKVTIHRLLENKKTELIKILSPGESYTVEEFDKTIEFIDLNSENSAIVRIAK